MVCERHEEVMEQLDDHEDRIKYLEIADTETKTEMKNLISTVKELIQELREEKKQRQDDEKRRTQVLVGGMSTAIVIMVGFFIWYIQTL